MKSLKQFIKESFDENEVQDLVVTYSICDGKYIKLYAPRTYSEDDIVSYLSDLILEKSPIGKKYINKFFGTNADKIIDVHLEYYNFVRDCEGGDVFTEWDGSYDNKKYDNDEMIYYRLDDVKMVVQFESFLLKVENSTDVDQILHKIFDNTESSNINKWYCNITLSKDNPFEYNASF